MDVVLRDGRLDLRRTLSTHDLADLQEDLWMSSYVTDGFDLRRTLSTRDLADMQEDLWTSSYAMDGFECRITSQ